MASREVEGETRRPGPGEAVGLKKFVQEMKGKTHRVLEMRIVLVCAAGIAARVIFASRTEEVTLRSSLLFIAVCLLVMMFSTWLDYFPSRLKSIQPRAAEGQGIPLACLLLPTVCCGALYSAMYNSAYFVGILSLYLSVLCVLSVSSIAATLLHSIPYPNSIIFYTFAVFGITMAAHHWLEIPLWLLMEVAALYSMLVPWLLHSFPLSFTLGEAMIVSQGLSIMLTDTTTQLLQLYGLISLPRTLDMLRSEAILYLEVLVSGVFLCCLLLSPALYKISTAKRHYEKKFWSGSFILLSLSIGVMLVLPWLRDLLGGQNPVGYIFLYIFSRNVRPVLVVFWLMISVVTGVLVAAQTSTAACLAPFRAIKPSSLWTRKWFHLLAFLVYLPGVALDPSFLAFSAALLTFLFVLVELARLLRIWPLGEYIHSLLHPMVDPRDAGPLVLTHLYLLLGFSLPVWLYPLKRYNQASKLSMYSGVLALGIGDSIAAVAGKLLGKNKWPGTRKTVEGTLMSVMTQMLGVLLIILIDPNLSFFSLRQWGIVVGSVVITAVLEAYTWQIDNLILGLFQFALFVSFL